MAVYLDGYQDLKLGLVQSAYANGSSMEYVNKTWGGFSPQRKFASQSLKSSMSVCFEANGLETVVLSEKAIGSIMEAGTNAK